MASFIGGNAGTPIKGTNTNDNAAAGNVGETQSATATATFPSTGVYGDLTSISLTAGDWLVSGIVLAVSTATTFTEMFAGISTTSGNSTTGLTLGDNWVAWDAETATGNISGKQVTLTIPSYRMSLSGASTTVYLKYDAAYTGTAPSGRGRITAVRIR